MHEAVLPLCLLRDYPYALECLACYDNFLLVGTKQGLLLVYELTPKSLNHPLYHIPPIKSKPISEKLIQLNFDTNPNEEVYSTAESPPGPPHFSTRVHTTRTFGRKPILQLEAIPRMDILLALSEGQMNVYQLQNCQLISPVPSSKGATRFSYYCSPMTSFSDGVDSSGSSYTSGGSATRSSINPAVAFCLRICVVVKRRLYLWRWDGIGQKFVPPGGRMDPVTPDWPPEITLSDVPRAIHFCDSSHLVVGLRSEYLDVTITNGEIRTLSAPGRNQIPLISFLPGCFQTPSPDVEVHHILNFEYPNELNQKTLSEATSSGDTQHRSSPSSPYGIHDRRKGNRSLCNPLTTPMGLGKDESLLITTLADDALTGSSQLRWTGAPHLFHVFPPYLIGVYTGHGSVYLEPHSVQRKLNVVDYYMRRRLVAAGTMDRQIRKRMPAYYYAMDKFLEVRLADPCELVQQLTIPRVHAMTHSDGWLYAITAPHSPSTGETLSRNSPTPYDSSALMHSPDSASRRKSTNGSGNEVWLILSANRTTLVKHLVKRKEFDVALILAKEAPLMGQQAIETRQICILHAYHLYRQQEFTRALIVFTQQLVDPSDVLALFPGLLDESSQTTVRFPAEHEPPNRDQFVIAAEPIITYLLTWRRLIRQAMTSGRQHLASISSTQPIALGQLGQESVKPTTDVPIRCYTLTPGNSVSVSAERLSQVIDTSLLKCYLATNTARVAPLLRQVNSCQLNEAEKALQAHHRYQELVLLYQSHGLHRQALSLLQQLGCLLLKRHGREYTPSIGGTNHSDHSHPLPCVNSSKVDPTELEQIGRPIHTVEYLQNLGSVHFNLVSEFAEWIMQDYPVLWMRIFKAWEYQLLVDRQSESVRTIDANSSREKRAPSLAYRGHVIKYLELKAMHLIIPFLEQLIFARVTESDSESEEDEEDAVVEEEEKNERDCADETEADSVQREDRLEGSLNDTKSASHLSETSSSMTGYPHANIICDSLWRLPGAKRLAQETGATDPDLLPPILRHTDDADPVELHTRYAAALMARVRSIQPAGQALACRVLDERPKWGAVARLRRRLFRFLNHTSANYSAQKLLAKCPYDALFEERTLLLAKLNQHEQAMTLWVHVLNDWNRAVSHCVHVHQRADADSPVGIDSNNATVPTSNSVAVNRNTASFPSLPLSSSVPTAARARSFVHDSDNSEVGSLRSGQLTMLDECRSNGMDVEPMVQNVERDIFLLLVQICVQPPDPVSLGIILPRQLNGIVQDTEHFAPKPERALEVLHHFGDRMNASQALRILLPSVRLSKIAEFLKTTLLHQESVRTQLVFLSNAAKAEMSASRSGLVRATGQQFLLSAAARCRTCRRRIGTSAFARHPLTGELEHYGCCGGV